MDEYSFLNERKSLIDSGNLAGLEFLERDALIRVQEFLDGKIAAEVDTAPLFYSFFSEFSETENVDLKNVCEKALIKLQPFLDAFDEENDLPNLDDLDERVIEYNMEALSVFEQINPFELNQKDQLVFPVFSDLYHVINNIDVTDENGQKSDAAHENFVDALIEAARSQTFTKLSFYKEKVTEDLYLDSLRENMEIGLVTMFAIDRVPTDKPLNDETKDFIESEYQRLLDSI